MNEILKAAEESDDLEHKPNYKKYPFDNDDEKNI
jgi:hypothetical protein